MNIRRSRHRLFNHRHFPRVHLRPDNDSSSPEMLTLLPALLCSSFPFLAPPIANITVSINAQIDSFLLLLSTMRMYLVPTLFLTLYKYPYSIGFYYSSFYYYTKLLTSCSPSKYLNNSCCASLPESSSSM